MMTRSIRNFFRAANPVSRTPRSLASTALLIGCSALVLSSSSAWAAGTPERSLTEDASVALKVSTAAGSILQLDGALPDKVNAAKIVLVAANISDAEVAQYAAKGKALAKKDRLASVLRSRQGQGAGQFGFDVGLAVAKGQTAPGPGKDRIGDALSAAERQGFDVAVAFTLERNRNAKLAAVGASIANEDDEVQEARTADRDVFYWLGFDIATGIFGDPALGARGNTATGPGSLGIRDALVSAAARQGFNDSVAFHLARAY